MKAFAELYAALDATTRTNEVEWAIAEANIPEWIFGDCYSAVGDLAETIALLLPAPSLSSSRPLHYWIEERLLPLREWSDEQRRESLVDAWRAMDEGQRFVWNKLITGEFRVGVSQNLVVRALASLTGLSTDVVAHRLMGDWLPDASFYSTLIAKGLIEKDTDDADVSRPYPFFLAYPIEGDMAQLGDAAEWMAEWKWDGIRSQTIRRKGKTFIWSRGEELVTERLPSRRCSGALGERFWGRRSWRMCRSYCWLTTCWRGAAKIFANGPSRSAEPSWRRLCQARGRS
jgi:DNA ligase-1